jgi:hypothetical protein
VVTPACNFRTVKCVFRLGGHTCIHGLHPINAYLPPLKFPQASNDFLEEFLVPNHGSGPLVVAHFSKFAKDGASLEVPGVGGTTFYNGFSRMRDLRL